MEVQAISEQVFSVYVPEAELESRRLDPSGITERQALELVDGVLGRGTLWDGGLDAVSLELYPGRHDLLIFVKRCSGEPEFYRFRSLEELLAAVEALFPAAASLFFCDGAYILAVWPGDRPGRDLAEFGEPLPAPGAYLLHLREHGRLLAGGDAAERLRRAFWG